jgi:hypothetical protein
MTAPDPHAQPGTPPAPIAAPTQGAAVSATVPKAPRGFRAIFDKHNDPLTSVALTLPVFLAYHLGILLVTPRAGVDLVSGLVFALIEKSVPLYVGVTFALALLLSGIVWIKQKRGTVGQARLGPVLIESAVYSVAMLVTVGWATHRLARTLDSGATQSLSVLDKVVLAAGAGFHEELVFRVLMVSGLALFVERMFRVERAIALVGAVIGSSIAFSLAYNFGPYGEPLVLQANVYRMLLGVFLSGVFLWRGFAVVVYTHTLYALLVYFVYA